MELTELPPGLGYGCGVTAIDYNDAIKLIQDKIFKGLPIPEIKTLIENVDIQALDADHVLPNMLPPNKRGIWFPIGY